MRGDGHPSGSRRFGRTIGRMPGREGLARRAQLPALQGSRTEHAPCWEATQPRQGARPKSMISRARPVIRNTPLPFRPTARTRTQTGTPRLPNPTRRVTRRCRRAARSPTTGDHFRTKRSPPDIGCNRTRARYPELPIRATPTTGAIPLSSSLFEPFLSVVSYAPLLHSSPSAVRDVPCEQSGRDRKADEKPDTRPCALGERPVPSAATPASRRTRAHDEQKDDEGKEVVEASCDEVVDALTDTEVGAGHALTHDKCHRLGQLRAPRISADRRCLSPCCG